MPKVSSSSFVYANDKPVTIVVNNEDEKIKDILALKNEKEEDIIEAFVAGKRKRAADVQPKKKQRQAIDDELDWSGDESEMWNSISKLDSSTLTTTDTTETRDTPDSPDWLD